MKSLVKSLVLFALIGCIAAAAVEPIATEQKPSNNEANPQDAPPVVDDDCHQPKEIGRCFALFYRYAFNVETQKCEEFIYGGCMGNKNNFETMEDCESKCMKVIAAEADVKTAGNKTDEETKDSKQSNDEKPEASETTVKAADSSAGESKDSQQKKEQNPEIPSKDGAGQSEEREKSSSKADADDASKKDDSQPKRDN